MSSIADRLRERIQQRRARVGVVGLGYVGLPLAGVDGVAILTDHRAFDYDAIVAAVPLVVDTRNAIKQPHPHVFKLGAPQLMHAEPWQPAASNQAS
jgi:UDP-N-acetyl-D-mannosaminuronate dehydrogenase